LPPSDINLLETKEFWEEIVDEMKKLDQILTIKTLKVEKI